MPDHTAVVDNFYDAWNRHDVAAIVEPFAATGLYADPLTRIDVRGDALTDHVQSVIDVIRDLHITVTRAIEKVGRARRCTLVPYAFEGISTWLQRLDRFAQVVQRTKGAR
jgi:hypothetical protein